MNGMMKTAVMRTNSSNILTYLPVRVGSENYALDMSWVKTVQQVTRLRLDRTEDGPLGWVTLLGNEMPVYSLAAQLGQPPNYATVDGRVVVLDTEPAWGMLVDSVGQARGVEASEVMPLPDYMTDPTQRYFEGLVRSQESLTLLLFPPSLHPDLTVQAEGQQQLNGRVAQFGSQLNEFGSTLRSSIGGQGAEARLVLFSLLEEDEPDGERPLSFGLSASQVLQIVSPAGLQSVAGSPGFVRGVMPWREWAVPVVDLGQLVRHQLPVTLPEPTKYRIIVGRDAKGALVGIAVQPNIRTLQLPVPNVPSNNPPALDFQLVQGCFELANETLAILDLNKIL